MPLQDHWNASSKFTASGFLATVPSVPQCESRAIRQQRTLELRLAAQKATQICSTTEHSRQSGRHSAIGRKYEQSNIATRSKAADASITLQ